MGEDTFSLCARRTVISMVAGNVARLASLFLEVTSLSPSSQPKGDDGSQTFPEALLEGDGLNHRAGERLEFMQFGGCWVFAKRFGLCHIL